METRKLTGQAKWKEQKCLRLEEKKAKELTNLSSLLCSNIWRPERSSPLK